MDALDLSNYNMNMNMTEVKAFNGLCPECKELGQKSTVCVGSSSMTLMGSRPYYDEDGHYHNENPNLIMTDYRCSRGHKWRSTMRIKDMLKKPAVDIVYL